MKPTTLAGKSLRRWVAVINLGWAAWALVGGIYFLKARQVVGGDTTFSLFHRYMHGYEIVGITLMVCGIVSLLAVCMAKLQRTAAILSGMWCMGAAVVMQFATPQFDQGDIDAWLLLMCGFTCFMRWALLVLEPHVDD